MGTRTFEVSETIDRPIDSVWSLMTDFDRAPEWMAEVVRIERDPSVPPCLGTKLATYVKRSKAAMQTEIVAWTPPEELALASRQGGISAIYRYRLAPAASGTHVTLNASCTAQGLLWRLLHPLIFIMMKRADGGQLAALKALVES